MRRICTTSQNSIHSCRSHWERLEHLSLHIGMGTRGSACLNMANRVEERFGGPLGGCWWGKGGGRVPGRTPLSHYPCCSARIQMYTLNITTKKSAKQRVLQVQKKSALVRSLFLNSPRLLSARRRREHTHTHTHTHTHDTPTPIHTHTHDTPTPIHTHTHYVESSQTVKPLQANGALGSSATHQTHAHTHTHTQTHTHTR